MTYHRHSDNYSHPFHYLSLKLHYDRLIWCEQRENVVRISNCDRISFAYLASLHLYIVVHDKSFSFAGNASDLVLLWRRTRFPRSTFLHIFIHTSIRHLPKANVTHNKVYNNLFTEMMWKWSHIQVVLQVLRLILTPLSLATLDVQASTELTFLSLHLQRYTTNTYFSLTCLEPARLLSSALA